MATTKRSTSHTKKSASTKKSSSASSTPSQTHKSASARSRSTGTAAKAHSRRASSSTTSKHSENPSSTGHGKAKKEPAKQTSHCWPGYTAVAGKKPGTKGSCKPKASKSASEKKSDGMAAAASKLRKAGGSKAKANHSK